MTNGGFIFFRNSKETNSAYNKIKNYKISGFYVFEINQKRNLSFYYKINLKTYRNLKKDNLNSIKQVKLIKAFDYEKKIRSNKANSYVNINQIEKFLSEVELIKTTGKHDTNGDIFFKNLKINKNTNIIENHKIFSLINNYY